MTQLYVHTGDTVPTDSIKTDDLVKNIRQTNDATAQADLVNSIREIGLIAPLAVLPIEDETGEVSHHLINGSRRLNAIREIRRQDPTFMPDVPVVWFDGDLAQAAFSNAVENLDREDVNIVDECEWVRDQANAGLSSTTIAEGLRRRVEWVDMRLFFIRNACDQLVSTLRSGNISWTTAVAIAKQTKIVQEALLKKFASGLKKLTKEDVSTATSDRKTNNRPNANALTGMLQRVDKALSGLTEEQVESSNGQRVVGMHVTLKYALGECTPDDLVEALTEAIGA